MDKKYSLIKMREEYILDFIDTRTTGKEIFEFHGSNNQHISMYRGSGLHHHLVRAFNELAEESERTGKMVYLVDIDDMIKRECYSYYYGKRMEMANKKKVKGKHLERKGEVSWK